MNESKLVEFIRSALNQGTRQLDRDTLSRLSAARRAAVARLPEARHESVLAAAGGVSHGGRVHPSRRWAAAGVLLIALTAAVYWHSLEREPDVADLDAALLSSELPLKAFTDPGFPAWLKRAEQ